MAINFGENLSGTLGQTLSMNQQGMQQARQLKRLIQRDQFNRQIQTLAKKMQQKRLQLNQEKFERQLINDVLDRERQRDQDALNKRATEKQIENMQSLIESRNERAGEGEDKVNQGAVSIELQAKENNASKMRQELSRLQDLQGQVFDTGRVPDEFAGDLEDPNPTNVLFSLTNQIVRRKKELDSIESRIQELKELAGTASPSSNESEEESAPLDNL